jgi:hypothetical protein
LDESEFKLEQIPGVDYFDPMIRVGGIDLLLDNNFDLVIAPNGDSRLAVGLTNIIQKAKVGLATVQGSVLHHPEYGLPISVGMASSEVSANDILNAAKNLFSQDPTFSGVSSASVLKQGNGIFLQLALGIAGTSQIIPLSVKFD